jgi:hypothetical protein
MIANTEPQGIGEMRIEKRGGSGPASKLTPDPHTTANLNRKARVVA